MIASRRDPSRDARLRVEPPALVVRTAVSETVGHPPKVLAGFAIEPAGSEKIPARPHTYALPFTS